jgi:phage gpG-like protein
MKTSAADFFKKFKEDIPKMQAEILEKIIRVEAEREFAQNFRTQSWETTTGNRDPWQKRKNETERPDKENGQRHLLVKSGRLKKAATSGKVIGNKVVFDVNLPYAKIHNEGGTETFTQSVKAHTRATTHYYEKAKYRTGATHTVSAHSRSVTRTMPKRQFMGDSQALDDKIKAKIDKYIKGKLKAN